MDKNSPIFDLQTSPTALPILFLQNILLYFCSLHWDTQYVHYGLKKLHVRSTSKEKGSLGLICLFFVLFYHQLRMTIINRQIIVKKPHMTAHPVTCSYNYYLLPPSSTRCNLNGKQLFHPFAVVTQDSVTLYIPLYVNLLIIYWQTALIYTYCTSIQYLQ